MKRSVLGILVIVAIALLFNGARQSSGPSPSTQRAEPVQYRHIVREDPPLHAHVITVDLHDPRVCLRVCPGGDDPDGEGPWQTTIRSVREIAQNNNLIAAVNGNFFTCKEAKEFAGRRIPYFTGNWANAVGTAMTDGRIWSRIDGGGQSMIVSRNGRVSFGYVARELPVDAFEIASGSEMLVKDGKVVATAKDLAPRTVVGVNRDGSSLVMLVVDGRKTDHSVGMTGTQAAKQMLDLGCWNALNLDGGGSSTMVMRDPITGEIKVMNRPSDGHDLPISMSLERPVACALGVEIVEERK